MQALFDGFILSYQAEIRECENNIHNARQVLDSNIAKLTLMKGTVMSPEEFEAKMAECRAEIIGARKTIDENNHKILLTSVMMAALRGEGQEPTSDDDTEDGSEDESDEETEIIWQLFGRHTTQQTE